MCIWWPAFSFCSHTNISPSDTYEWKEDWWMDGWVRVLHPFNSISVISRRWKGEHERLCAMKRRLGSGRISPPVGFEPTTPWSEVGSAYRSATWTLLKGRLRIFVILKFYKNQDHISHWDKISQNLADLKANSDKIFPFSQNFQTILQHILRRNKHNALNCVYHKLLSVK